MGLGYSQFNLLAITAREHAIGKELMFLAGTKIAMSREQDALALKYNDALNEKHLKWSNDAGATMYDLTFNTLMQPSQLNSYEPYMLTDMAGKVVIDDKYKKYAEMISANGAPGGNYVANRTKILSELLGVSESDFGTNTTHNDNVNNKQSELDKLLAQEPEITSTTATELFIRMGKVSSSAVTDKTGKVGGSKDVTSGTTWSDIVTSIQTGDNYVTYLDYDGSAEGANKKFKQILQDFATAVTKVSGNWAGIDNSAIQNAMNKTYTQFTENYAYDEAQQHDHREYAGERASGYNTICHQHDKKSNIFDGSNHAYAVSLTNMANVFLTYLLGDEEAQESITDNSGAYIKTDDITLIDRASQAKHDEWAAKVAEKEGEITDVEEEYTEPFDAEVLKKIDFYDAIFNAIETNGWTFNEYINDTDYLNNIMQTGLYNITKAEKGGNGWVYDESAPTTCQNIYQVTDNNAINEATNDYELEKARLTKKESEIDVRMKKLETEQSALKEMKEGIKSMRNDNVDRTYDVFG